jgi:hypothetical protein
MHITHMFNLVEQRLSESSWAYYLIKRRCVRSKGPFFETPEVLFAMENILYL